MLNTVRSTSVSALSALLALALVAVFSGEAGAWHIGDRVWLDLNCDGIQDAGEPGVYGVTVTVYMSDGTFVASTSTDNSGYYIVYPGDGVATYFVEFELPSGYVFTLKDQGINDAVDSDANEFGVTDQFTLDDSYPYTDDVDAGLCEEAPPEKASIGDLVWGDLNADGIQNAGEPGIGGVTVRLYDCLDNLVATTTTDANGLYLFADLAPGGYYVEFVLPSGYSFSPQNQGSDDAVDSDADTTTGKAACTMLDSGETDLTWDAGMYQPPLGPCGFGTPGYWKKRDWPVDEITINGVTYPVEGEFGARWWLNQPVKGDKTITMFKALVAAKLNALCDESWCIDETIAAAEDWMEEHGPVGSGETEWNGGQALYLELDDYNNGRLACGDNY